MDMVHSSTVRGLGPDWICWKPAKSRGFKVRGFYRSFYPLILPLENDMAIEGSSKGGFHFMVSFFRKILTTDNFCKKGIIVLDWCYMCKRCEESVDHLLLHCPMTFEMWSLVLCLFGL